MFKPRFTITSKLLNNLKRIAALTALLNERRFPATIMVRLERSARELSAYSSTSIEGNPLPLTEVKRILKNRPAALRDSEREVLNYNRALEILKNKVSRKDDGFSLSLILDIHRQIMDGLALKSRCGRLRTEPVFVNNPKTRKPAYLPPDHKDVRALMNELVGFVQKNRGALDPLILAGLLHKQFVIIHPFADGNGRTGRLVTKFLLAAMGVDTFNLFSFENYYNRNVTRYFEKVGVFGNYYELEDKTDFTEWLEYFTDGIIDELLRVGKELQVAIATPETKLLGHHRIILNFIEKHGFITDRDYSKLTERAKATRALDFKKLIGLGIIERHGKGKNTNYRLMGKS